jgi:dihydrofolate synthase / folylpolyglutamate synthase
MARFHSLQDWLTWQEGLHPRVIDLGLERATSIYKQLNPDNSKPLTVTVAGTNGKGSCVAYLEAIYRAQGYKVGAYTSPHIIDYNERIKINGKPVVDNTICEAFSRIDEVRADTTLSYFEFGTLAALDIFRRADVDVQLLEVGLGGRLDAVNIIDADVAIITSICIDHVDWLGETRELIGQEKAGIFRRGIPAVIGDPDPPNSLFTTAAEKGTPLFSINQDFSYQLGAEGWNWQANKMTLSTLPFPGLKGEHQLRNASTVLTAVNLLNDKLPITEASIRKGLADVKLSGRFQLVGGDIPVLLDVCHNPHAAYSLLDYLQKAFGEYKIHAVFAMMRDKDIASVIQILSPVISSWHLAPLQNKRAASEEVMLEAFKGIESGDIFSGFSNFEQTFADAESRAQKGDLILVFGSFFLVSEYLTMNSAERQQ